MKTTHTISFNLKGYDRVIAIHKLKQNIHKYGDRLGKKHKILNNIERRDTIGYNLINLSINRTKPKEEKSSFKINLLNKKILQSLVNDKKFNPNNNNYSIKPELTKTLNDEKFQNEYENEILSSSNDYNIRETDLFSPNNKIFINDISNSKRNKDKNLPHINLFKRKKNVNTIRKNKTQYNNYKLLNKAVSPINNNINKNDIQEKEQVIRSKLKNNKYDSIIFRNKKIIPKFRSLKLGTKFKKTKLNFKIIKLGRNFSTRNLKLNEENIKTRTLFYKKYKKTKDMKLTKIKKSKSQNDIEENKIELYNVEQKNVIENENKKNFGQQTINENDMNNNRRYSFNLLKRIYSYIRLPNINKINFPKKSLKSENNDCGINLDFYNDNYFYLKDVKKQSINKIYMINPFIRNRIINNLIYY